tara:strand:+ start:134 stop:496 length:363 start_codon:yes stop_codon:yes gene_type:complete
MPLLITQLNFDNINMSAQVGDVVYYSTLGSPLGGFNQVPTSNTFLLGNIVGISAGNISVQYDDQITSPPPLGAYISFAKDKKVNTSSLVGYYASAKFINTSREKNVELFSVGSEVSESSK